MHDYPLPAQFSALAEATRRAEEVATVRLAVSRAAAAAAYPSLMCRLIAECGAQCPLQPGLADVAPLVA